MRYRNGCQVFSDLETEEMMHERLPNVMPNETTGRRAGFQMKKRKLTLYLREHSNVNKILIVCPQ